MAVPLRYSLRNALVRKWGHEAGASICVGDPWQALYTWRGAHVELFNDPSVPRSHRDVLSRSYRVPRRVHPHESHKKRCCCF